MPDSLWYPLGSFPLVPLKHVLFGNPWAHSLLYPLGSFPSVPLGLIPFGNPLSMFPSVPLGLIPFGTPWAHSLRYPLSMFHSVPLGLVPFGTPWARSLWYTLGSFPLVHLEVVIGFTKTWIDILWRKLKTLFAVWFLTVTSFFRTKTHFKVGTESN